MAVEIYVGCRQYGKTVWIIKKSANTGIPIATGTKKQAEELLKRAKKMGYSIPDPVYNLYKL